MAFDEALEQGVLPRKVEHVIHAENGLPNGSAKNAVDGYRWLVDQGCIVDRRRLQLRQRDRGRARTPTKRKVPLISWCGTERYSGEYCFQLGNGDCGGDAALMAAWLKRKGFERIAVLNEISPNGEEYFRFFRQECRRLGLERRRGRDRAAAAAESRREPAQPAARRLRRARLHGLRDARRAGPRCARRSTRSAGIRRAS